MTDNNKETPKTYNEPNQVRAILFGYLVRNEGKVQTSKMNKLLKEVEQDKISVDELKDFAQTLSENAELSDIARQAKEGVITLDDIGTPYNDEIKPLKDKSASDIVTPYVVNIKDMQKQTRAFNKARREGAYLRILLDEMQEALKQDIESLDTGVERDPDMDFKLKGSSLIVTLSDLHVGKLVNPHHYVGIGYDFETLIKRLKVYLKEIKKFVQIHNVDNIRLYFVGDAVENTNMRSDQSFSAEFDTGEQTAKATRTIVWFLNQLQELAPVKFGMVKGNHDRIASNKKEAIHNESFAYIILDFIIFLKESGQLQNVQVIDNRQELRLFTDEVGNKLVAVTHGDFIKGNKNKLGQLGIENLDMLVTGHLHTFALTQENSDTYHLQVGSVVGNDEYASENNLSSNTIPSQTMLVVNPDLKGYITYTPHLTSDEDDTRGVSHSVI